MSYHEIEIIGFLVNDPDMRYTPTGQAVTHFRIRVKDGKEKTIWFNCTTWGTLAEACNEHLHNKDMVFGKGRLVHESGSPKIFKKRDGTSGTSFEISLSFMRFLSTDKPEFVQEETDNPIPF